jgi:hypothetical protein
MPRRQNHRHIALEFQPEEGQRKELSLVPIDGTASTNVGWLYFNQPGTLQITTTGSRPEPTVRSMGFAELVSNSRNTGFAKAELTVTFLCDFLPMGALILVICGLRWLAYCVIRRLPRTVRKHAQRSGPGPSRGKMGRGWVLCRLDHKRRTGRSRDSFRCLMGPILTDVAVGLPIADMVRYWNGSDAMAAWTL